MKHIITSCLVIFLSINTGCRAKTETEAMPETTDTTLHDARGGEQFQNSRPFTMTILQSEDMQSAARDFYEMYAGDIREFLNNSNTTMFQAVTPEGNYHYPVEINNPEGAHTVLYDIDCDGDGIYESTGLTGDHICEYDAPGPHRISIRGSVPGLYLGERENSSAPIGKGGSVASIDQWGDIRWKAMNLMAAGCFMMTVRAADVPDTRDVKDMSGAFLHAKKFNQPVEKWNMKNVTNMSFMFRNAVSFNQPVEKWDTGSVSDMSYMFEYAADFNQPVEKWNMKNVTNMSFMFRNAESFNQPVEKWDTGNVSSMMGMFMDAENFDQPVEKWNTKNVTNMSYMFAGAMRFNHPVEQWNIENVTSMSGMFQNAPNFKQSLKQWNLRQRKNIDIHGFMADRTREDEIL